MKNILTFTLLLLLCNCQSQDKGLKNRDVVYYFKEAKALENKERIKQKFAIDSITVHDEYLDPVTKKINNKGLNKLQEIKEKVLTPYYSDYLFLKKLNHNGKIYTLYFTMLTLYDIEFVVYRFDDGKWNNIERISRKLPNANDYLMKLKWNYDEAPKKKLHEADIFIKNDYLVFNLGEIYLSLYDLKTNELLFKETNPFSLSKLYDRESNETWVKENIHHKIQMKLNEKRK